MLSNAVLFFGAIAPLLSSTLAAPVDDGHQLVRRDITIDPNSCNAGQIQLITQELNAARQMAQKGKTITAASQYYQTIFSANNKNTPGFEVAVQTKYGKLFDLVADKNYHVTISCLSGDQAGCTGTRNAWTNAGTNQINLCPPWFDNSVKARTVDIQTACQPGSPNAGNWADLSQFKASKAYTLLHEFTHLSYITGDTANRARDYAYGLNDCKSLAAGTMQNPKLCPNGPCDQTLSFNNADSIAFVVAGEYFSSMCGKTITTNLNGAAAKNDTPDDWDSSNVVEVIPIPATKRAVAVGSAPTAL